MKKAINLYLAAFILLGSGLTIVSCNDTNEAVLSQDDRLALEGMYTAYENAKIENNNVLIALEEEDSVAVHEHDSLFHHYEGEFLMHHNNYRHDNEHDDHHHDSHGMHMMGSGGMMHDVWEDGHHQENHELMEGLVNEHDHAVH